MSGHGRNWRAGTITPRLYLWAAVIALQAGCFLFFVGDVTLDMVSIGFVAHTTGEFVATLALACGAVLGAVELRRQISRTKTAEDTLEAATAAFGQLVQDRFTAWKLTPGEAEVALLTLKGFDIAEIAKIRSAAPGTVRSQLSQLYAKSGAGNRGQFVSSFIDVLIDSRTEAA